MMFLKIVIFTVLCNILLAVGLPQATSNLHNVVDSFQNAVQQQTFQSVLLAIEERLRNLDNIYSMQLSETIKSKLDQYHRKLESLDLKIIRLESLVMLNLNKISENISTKNYKDDIALSQVYRKLDNMYDGLSHRINYMDRKADMTFDKLQNKIDTTLLRMEKMEENMMQRNSDIETELSETLFVIEDLKTSSENTEQSLVNITAILNQTLSTTPMMHSINLTMQNLIRNFNESFTQRLEKMENISLSDLNVSEENNNFLKSMKLELKEDFNEYANKVADMNVDIWKKNDVADGSLKTIETVTNATIIEVQNGVRSLILQISKLSGKGPTNDDKISLESLRKTVNLSLEKIITNQELFLESCHRVQMDESQIESEISDMLGKLIDMLEKKMTTVMKDIKSLEKTVKNHDSRTTRNIYQANTNIVTLFEKNTKSSETTEKELQEIKFYINSLFTFVQDVLPKSVNGTHQNTEVMLDVSTNITNLIKGMNFISDTKWIQLTSNITKQNNLTQQINDQIKNISEALVKIELISQTILSNKSDRVLEDMRNRPFDDKRNNYIGIANVSNTDFITTDSVGSMNTSDVNGKRNCTPDYGDLIDIRADGSNCNNNVEDLALQNTGDTKPPVFVNGDNLNENEEKIAKNDITIRPQDDEQLKKAILDIFGTPPPSVINAKSVTDITIRPQDDEQLKKAVLDIFGTPPPSVTTLNKTELTKPKHKKKCVPAWANLINIRADATVKGEECEVSTTRIKKRKNRRKIQSRIKDDNSLEDDDTEYIDGTTENSPTTDSSTEILMSSTENPELENLEQLANI